MSSIRPGSRIGLAPPPGMTVSQGFSGFEDRDKRVALVVVALPGRRLSRHREVDHARDCCRSRASRSNARRCHASARQGVAGASDRQQIENVTHPQMDFRGAGRRAHRAGDHADARGCASRLSRSRDPRRADECIGASERSGRRAVEPAAVPAGRACRLQGRRRHRRPRVMLTDGPLNQPAAAIDTHILVAVAPGGPAQASEREPLRAGGVRHRPEHEGCPDQLVRGAAHRRPAGPPDHGARQGRRDRRRGHDRAVAALRRQRLSARDRRGAQRTAGPQAYARFRQVRDGIDCAERRPERGSPGV